jgi:hypothetical protein
MWIAKSPSIRSLINAFIYFIYNEIDIEIDGGEGWMEK